MSVQGISSLIEKLDRIEYPSAESGQLTRVEALRKLVEEELDEGAVSVDIPTTQHGFKVDKVGLSSEGKSIPVRAVQFSGSTPTGGVTGPIVHVGSGGCRNSEYRAINAAGAIAVTDRGGCDFNAKAIAAANANVKALIIVNSDNQLPTTWSLYPSDQAIPVAAMPRDARAELKQGATATVEILAKSTARPVGHLLMAADKQVDSNEPALFIGAQVADTPALAAALSAFLRLKRTVAWSRVRFLAWEGQSAELAVRGAAEYSGAFAPPPTIKNSVLLEFETDKDGSADTFTRYSSPASSSTVIRVVDSIKKHLGSGSIADSRAAKDAVSRVVIRTQKKQDDQQFKDQLSSNSQRIVDAVRSVSSS